jgi:Uma2 family endonuclease
MKEATPMAMTGVRRITLEEFRALPEGPPYFEFEDGELVMAASPTPERQDVVGELWHALRQFVRHHTLGRVFREVDVYLPDGRVYIPDIALL